MGIKQYFRSREYTTVSSSINPERPRRSNTVSSITSSIPSKWRQLRSGWRFGVFLSCLFSILLFTINTGTAIYATSRFPVDSDTGLGTIFNGPCKKTKEVNVALHVLINIISTALLAASNYTTQVLVSPTRADVDRQHSKGQYVDIGVQSMRNLRLIPWWRRILWALLILSSVPLHLLFNSAVFNSSSSNRYQMAPVTEGFLEDFRAGKQFNETVIKGFAGTPEDISYGDLGLWSRYGDRGQNPGDIDAFKNLLRSSSNFTKLSPSQCRQDYATEMLSGRRNLIVVLGENHDFEFIPSLDSKEFKEIQRKLEEFRSRDGAGERARDQYKDLFDNFVNHTIMTVVPIDVVMLKRHQYSSGRSFSWICTKQGYFNYASSPGMSFGEHECLLPEDSEYDANSKNMDNWRLFGRDVKYCLSETVPENCRLQFNSAILYTVITMNLVKVLVMAAALIFYKGDHELLVTVGDAIASFIEKPDTTTEGCLFLSKRDVKEGAWSRLVKGKQEAAESQNSWKGRRETRMFSSCSKRRWFFCYFLCAVAMILVGWALYDSIKDREDPIGLFRDFGGYDSRRIFTLDTSSFKIACLTNFPQIIASLLYLQYNAIYTSMTLTREWLSYAWDRKGLRVSYPQKKRITLSEDGTPLTIRPAQRGSHFLSLPLRYSLPLAAFSALLHWIISQACFFAQITIVGGRDPAVSLGVDPYRLDKTNDYEVSAAVKAPTPMVAVFLVGGFLLLAALGFGWRELPGRGYASEMPIVGSCSAAISAACHLGREERDRVSMRDDYSGLDSYGRSSASLGVGGAEEGLELQGLSRSGTSGGSGCDQGCISGKQKLRVSEQKLMWGLTDWAAFASGSSADSEAVQAKLAHCGFSSLEVGILRKRRSDKVPAGAGSESSEEDAGNNAGFKPLGESRFLGFLRKGGMGRGGDLLPVVYRARVWSRIHGFVDVGFSPESSAASGRR